MSHFEIGKASTTTTAEQQNTSATSKWPHDQLAHMAVHTPIQARCPDNTQSSLPTYPNGSSKVGGVHLSQAYSYGRQTCFEPQQQSPPNAQPTDNYIPSSYTASESQVEPKHNVAANNNNNHDNGQTQEHWEGQQAWGGTTSVNIGDYGGITPTNPMGSPNPTAAAVGIATPQPIRSRQSTITPPASSQSTRLLSPADVKGFITDALPPPSPLDVEHTKTEENGGVEQPRMHTILDYAVDGETGTSNSKENCVLDQDEASKLLLNFSQNVSSVAGTDSTSASTSTNPSPQKPLESSSRVADAIVSGVVESLAADRAQEENLSSPSAPTNQQAQQQRSRTFFRAPGLEAPNSAAIAGAADNNVRVCHVCGFSCSSKFHYNSHMNTHGDHQCTMCNYTSRTEGRLRKHMKDSHTQEQRIAAGLEDLNGTPVLAANKAPCRSTGNSHNNHTAGGEQSTSSNNAFQLNGGSIGEGISTTMSSIVDMVNRAAAHATATANSGSCNDVLMRMVDMNSHEMNGGMRGMENGGGMGHASATINLNALDQIRALTERTNNPSPNQSISATLNGIFGMHSQANFPRASEEEVDVNGGYETNQNGRTFAATGSADQKAEAPRRTGRPKVYTCKQCKKPSSSKDEHWAHVKGHIPLEKQLTCKLPGCGFITEYKHHLEYHIRNHNGSKPFKCEIQLCKYQCVNKSMLNSHMKSHTAVYQFRCQDCTYQTKYCHSLKMHLRKYNHTRTPGIFDSDSHDEGNGRSESDDSNQLIDPQQYSLSVNEDPKGGIQSAEDAQTHPALNSMLLQPIVTTASMQYAQSLLRQQQMIRAASSNNMIACAQCDFTAGSNEEMVSHNMFAHILNQQHQQPRATLATLYQNLAAAQQQQQHNNAAQMILAQQQQPPVHSSPSDILSGPLELAAQLQAAKQEMALRIQDESRRQAMAAFATNIINNSHAVQEHAENINVISGLQPHCQEVGKADFRVEEHNMSPGTGSDQPEDSAAESSASPSGSKISADGGTSSGSPSSEATPGGSRKRKQSKTNKLEQISEKLQSKCSPDGKRTNYGEYNGHRVSKDGTETDSSNPLPQPIPSLPNASLLLGDTNGTFASLLAHHNQAHFKDQHRQTTMPYTCQHCMMAFQDRALYQIHLGYHGYEIPFKCNRCGHTSASSLEFNLHLYQAKHD